MEGETGSVPGRGVGGTREPAIEGPHLPSALATQLSQPDVPFVTPALDAVPECESHLGVQETVEEGHGESLGIKHSEINWGNRFNWHSVPRPTTH